MDESRLKYIIEKGESACVEFKRCGNGIESDVYETVCSFSNHFGGYILCGVLDNGEIVGVPENAVESMMKNFISVIGNPAMFAPTLYLTPEVVRVDNKCVIVIHVMNSSEVHSYKKVIYDRINDSDVKLTSTGKIAELYIRKQNIFTEQKVYKYVTEKELNGDLIDLCRMRAVNKRPDHPWKDMTDTELLKSAQLYATDWNTGETGINLAGILLLGRDDVIHSVCPVYKTDAILRKVNLDRYDDREIVKTNLIDSYELLIQFAQKHLWDKFFMEGTQTVSIRDKIIREMVSNILMHREFTSAWTSKLVIESEQIFTENPCKAMTYAELTPGSFSPNSKNPIIASFFNNIGNADELGSGTRNLFKYTKLYSGKSPRMIEDDIFRIIVPLDDSYSADASIAPLSVNPEPLQNELTKTQNHILEEIRKKPSVSAEELAGLLNLSSRTIETNIKKLKALGILHREGSNKTGYWEIIG